MIEDFTPLKAGSSEEIRCCVCGNSDPEKFKKLYEFHDCEIAECVQCSFTFVPPFWRKQVSYESYKSAEVANQIRKGNNWIKIQRHKLRFQLIRKFKPSGTLFDVGSGWGHFLLAGKELGYDIKGVELDKEPFLYSVNDLKLPVENRNFFEFSGETKFDIVTLWDVLEHIDDAEPFVMKCAELTKSGGIIVIQVPQIDSYIARKKKNSWNMMGLDHVNYFSPKTLGILLEKCGYEVETVKSSIELKLFLMYTVLPYLRRKKSKNTATVVNNTERQEYFNKVTKRPMWQLKLFIFIHDLVYKTLSALKIGEEMIVVARKK